MKKVLVGMFVALMGVFMLSCTNGGGIEKAKELINELKADGATLDKDGLKDKLMEIARAIKPEVSEMAELLGEVKESKDPSKAAGLLEKLKDFQEVETILTDMQKVVEENPAWKEIEEDEEFGKKFQEAMGNPEELFQ